MVEEHQLEARPLLVSLQILIVNQILNCYIGSFASNPSAFGAKPATGFGSTFGGTATGAFGGGTGAFGSAPSTGSSTLFGQPTGSTTTGAFGNTANTGATSLFGSKPSTTGAFGTTQAGERLSLIIPEQEHTSAFPDPNAPPPVVTTGTSNPPYQPFQEKDTSGVSAVTLHYQSISCMPAYRGSSFEVCNSNPLLKFSANLFCLPYLGTSFSRLRSRA